MVRRDQVLERKNPQTTLLPEGLPEVFKEIYYWLYTNSNVPRAERLGAEMVRILFCKIYDELYNEDESVFKVHPNENDSDASKRIKLLFEKVKNAYPDVFDKDEKLHLDDRSICYVTRRLQNYKLLGANRDVISEAFQAFWGPGLRGEKGQFFTPRNVIKLCVEFLEPKPGERIIDPACGSGGFLIESMNHLSRKIKESEMKSSFNNIFGIDKEIDLAKIAKTYMTIVGDGHSNIFCADSLDPDSWPEAMKEKIKEDSFDIVFTNPPFGARISVDDERILKRYKLGYAWKKIKDGQWKITGAILPRQAPQVLFLERCLQLLKPGGRMAIVLPDGVFGNPTDRYILQYIFQVSKVLAIVSLPPETFLPGTHTKTSVLFLEKRDLSMEKDEDYEIFMAIANRVGHDKDGKPLYKMDKSGRYILDEYGKRIIDDDLPEIVKRFRLFKKGELTEYDHLGFVINSSKIREREFILIPNYYDPEIESELNKLERSGKYELISIGELMKRGLISIRRGHEVGSRYYGMGSVPFVRTSDIVNWEIKVDPIKSIPEEIYEKYKKMQNIKENDVLLVTDGTFLIGRTAIVTSADEKIVIQSHIRRIRCLKPDVLHPYLLLYLLNTDIVQKQIKAKTFVQATISTVAGRLKEIVLPIPKERSLKEEIIEEVSKIIRMKVEAKLRISKLLNHFSI
jgi:type I restriction enzyme M protein